MSNKTWLITGATSGLGLGLTMMALSRGDKVIATARKNDAFIELKTKYPEQMTVVIMDLTNLASITKAVAQAFAVSDNVDYVVSNAGYGLFGAVEELTYEQIDKQISTNLTGSIYFIKASVPYLRAQKSGRIVQVSSEGGQIAYPNFSIYHAAKWGIEGFIESVAQELIDFNVDTLIIEPGPTDTNFASALELAEPLDDYKETTSGHFRDALSSGDFDIKGDQGNTVNAMFAAIDSKVSAKRLPLGSIAFDNIRAAYQKRLVMIEPLKDIAYSADKNTQ